MDILLCRAKRMPDGKWVEGYFYMNGGPYIFVPEEQESYAVDSKTLGECAGMTDVNKKDIFEGDIVDLFGMRGKIVRDSGAFGVYVQNFIDYDLLEKTLPYPGRADFCHADNFISLWELWWNYELIDDSLDCLEIIGNEFDRPDLIESK